MSEISRRAVFSTTGRAAVATLALGGVALAAGPLADDPLGVAVANHRIEARSNAIDVAGPSMSAEWVGRQEAAFNRLCDEACKSAWRLLEIEAMSVVGVIALLTLVSDYTSEDIWPAREDDKGRYRTFEAEALTYAARALTRLTGGQANV